MSHAHVFRALKEFGVVGTFMKLYKMRTLKFGALMGVDKYGNKYYQNTKDYPHGQHRWVEYAGNANFYETDSSNIPAEWHGWLHSVTDEVPTESTTGSTHRSQPVPAVVHSDAPYKRNLGGVITAHTPNLSSWKPRGYGLGNGLHGGSAPGEELFYTQPGYPMDKRNNYNPARRAQRLGFTVADNALTMTAKKAVKVGLSIDEYALYADADPRVRAAVKIAADAAREAATPSTALPAPQPPIAPLGASSTATAGAATAAATAAASSASTASSYPVVASSVPPEAARMLESAAFPLSLPIDNPSKMAAIESLVGARGSGRSWGPAAHGKGTFAGDAREVLTPEEEAMWANNVHNKRQLTAEVEKWQAAIDGYKNATNKAARAGVAQAEEYRDAAAAKLAMLDSIEKKLAVLEGRYAEKAQQAVREAMGAGSGSGSTMA